MYIWFGDTWALCGTFIAKLLGKRSIIVAGGYDVANEPSIGYGLLSRPLMRFVPLIAFGACDRIIAVSEFIAKEARRLVKGPDKVMVVYNGLNHSLFRDTGQERNTCTTVGNVTPSAYRVKGIDSFLKVVDNSPNEHFTLVGRTDLGIEVEKRANLDLSDYKVGEDLVEVLNRSKYYLQLSVREGFGLAVAEAMACGCVPVVTDRGALPEVVGDTGFVVPHGDWGKVSEIIQGEYDHAMGSQAMKRAIEMFTMDRREKAIVSIILEMMRGNSS